MVVLMKRLGAIMLKRSRPPSCSLAGFAIAILAVLILTAPASPYARPAPRPAVYVFLVDTGKTVPLQVGQQLVVKLPLRGILDDSWHVTKISPSLKLVAGPDEERPIHWSPWKPSFQVFYFQRESSGPADLVLEPSYFAKPMVLKVVGG
jgi:hypothetical protein